MKSCASPLRGYTTRGTNNSAGNLTIGRACAGDGEEERRGEKRKRTKLDLGSTRNMRSCEAKPRFRPGWKVAVRILARNLTLAADRSVDVNNMHRSNISGLISSDSRDSLDDTVFQHALPLSYSVPIPPASAGLQSEIASLYVVLRCDEHKL